MDMLMNQYWTITLHLQWMTDNDVPVFFFFFIRMNEFFFYCEPIEKTGR